MQLYADGGTRAVADDGDTITVCVGNAECRRSHKKPFSLRFFEDGKELTGLGRRHLGCVKTPDGWFMRAKLDVDVGEKLYGLGERFTPFVKNGQVVDIWNEDGGTSSELAYKNIPFYLTNRGLRRVRELHRQGELRAVLRSGGKRAVLRAGAQPGIHGDRRRRHENGA